MIQLLIIADDFTGGLDTGVQFIAKCIPTMVVTDPEVDYLQAAGTSEVLVVVAETRHLPAKKAFETVHEIVRKAEKLSIPYIYKKTDSALRGNIGAELSAVLEAGRGGILAFIPAMPALNRTTRGSIHYIEGTPVAQSVFGRDPFEPVTESNVLDLVRLQAEDAVYPGTPEQLPEQDGIWALDASSDSDLRAIAKALDARGALHLTAGCAGFAAVLPEILGMNRGEKPPIPLMDAGLFVLCGSVNPITQRQLACGKADGFLRVHIQPEQKLDPGYFKSECGRAALDGWHQQMTSVPYMILDANDETDDNQASQDYATMHGMDREEVRSCISGAMGEIFASLIKEDVTRTLLITGGDTLLQCMSRVGVLQMEPLQEIFPGIVLARFELEGKKRFVITKSGGFGSETLLPDLRKVIETPGLTGVR